MKTYVVIFAFFFPVLIFPQKDASPYDMAFFRIEQAFNNGFVGSIEDLFYTTVTLRIGDVLYKNISELQSKILLEKFFLDKDSIEFRFNGKVFEGQGATGNGVFTYTEDSKQESITADVYLSTFDGKVLISAINISSYPSSNWNL